MTGPIVVAGESLVDLIVDGAGGLRAALGGGPYNTARAIGRLGGEVAFLGCISRDHFGERSRRGLIEDGVDVGLAARTESPTTLALAELDEHSAARYRFYVDGTAAPEPVLGVWRCGHSSGVRGRCMSGRWDSSSSPSGRASRRSSGACRRTRS